MIPAAAIWSPGCGMSKRRTRRSNVFPFAPEACPLISSRSVRVAALALAFAGPLVTAVPADAAGEATTAVLTSPAAGSSSTFTWDYEFSRNGGHGLSNIAIGFCSAALLADVDSAVPNGEIFLRGDVPGQHAGFGPGIKFERKPSQERGTLTVTFKSRHPIAERGLRIQSHSGDGQSPDVTNVAKGPGPCPEDPPTATATSSSTTTTTSSSTTTTTTTTTSTSTTSTSTTTTTGVTGTTSSSTTTTTPSPITTTTGTDGTTTTTRALTPTATGLPPQVGGTNSTSEDPVAVLGETLEKGGVSPGPLARTGAGRVMLLAVLALSLVATGIALLGATRRRTGSTSSPG